MRGQVWHSFLRDDVLHLTLQKRFKKTAIMIGCLFLIFNSWQVHTESDLTYQVTRTSVTWLSPVIRWWTVCPSMVVICWIYAPSSWYRHAWVKLRYNIYKKTHIVQYLICWFLSYNDVFLSQGLQPLWGDCCLMCLQGCETCKEEVRELGDFLEYFLRIIQLQQ